MVNRVFWLSDAVDLVLEGLPSDSPGGAMPDPA